jgi:ribosomal protein L17
LGKDGKRDARGRFTKGNPGGPGNPYPKQVAKIRSVILECVSDQDLRAIIHKLVEQAKAGDIQAAREVLNRLAGKPSTGLDPEYLALAEKKLELQEDQVELQQERVDLQEERLTNQMLRCFPSRTDPSPLFEERP